MFERLRETLRERMEDLLYSGEEKRILLIFAGVILAISALFFALSQGSAHGASDAGSQVPALRTISPTPADVQKIVVDVAGKVMKPGVYTLPTPARAIDAIKAAGGARTGVDLSDINLAHILIDGEQILVGAPRPVITKRSTTKKGTLPSSIGINSATAAQFDSLPGIGPVMAARIVAYRTSHGAFTSIEDLRKVPGMGKSKFENLKAYIHL